MSSVRLNKVRLAHWLGVSLPTLARWLLKYGPEFPVIERGTNGREWQFDPEEVGDFLRRKQEEQQASEAERDDQLAQLRLPFDLPGVEPPPKASSPKEELDAWRVRKIAREEAQAAGALVPTADVIAAVSAVLTRISRDNAAFLRQIAREQSWPESYTHHLQKRLADQQRATVAALRDVLGPSAIEDAVHN